ncbi:uncharacterized protein LOC127791489 [Diospyros lotus]|uniref:uncharacterized protein LOC127791489 n=1 Tax=Diospyros lotus TaxID=55363 RepID=UPI00225BBB60|nr:uncharacterized protein LOC127791489 [Diospyros lotus]
MTSCQVVQSWPITCAATSWSKSDWWARLELGSSSIINLRNIKSGLSETTGEPMAEATTNLLRNSNGTGRSSGGPGSLGFMVFGFLDDGGCDTWRSFGGSGEEEIFENEDDSTDGEVKSSEEDKAFWESKEQSLLATLRRTSSFESKVRLATREAMRELELTGAPCACPRPVAGGCRNCLQREISQRLRIASYSCAIRQSRWRSSSDIPSGGHTYMEVVDSSSMKGEERVIIELNFRAEFEMARANEEYNRLVCRLPEVFVGKAKKLQALIRILCTAAKKCMKDRKMHMGPWRKQKYMEAKWFGTCERTPVAAVQPTTFSGHQPNARVSMLTSDLVGGLPDFHCRPSVKVV